MLQQGLLRYRNRFPDWWRLNSITALLRLQSIVIPLVFEPNGLSQREKCTTQCFERALMSNCVCLWVARYQCRSLRLLLHSIAINLLNSPIFIVWLFLKTKSSQLRHHPSIVAYRAKVSDGLSVNMNVFQCRGVLHCHSIADSLGTGEKWQKGGVWGEHNIVKSGATN